MEPIVKGLGHIGIYTTDPDRAIKFYSKHLDFEHFYSHDLETEGGVVKLRFIRKGGCIIEFIQPADTSAIEGLKTGVIAHVCIEVLGIEALVERMKAKGVDTFREDKVSVLPDLFPTGSKSIFLVGPCGEIIELYEYTGR